MLKGFFHKKGENVNFWFSKVFVVGIIKNTEKNFGISKSTTTLRLFKLTEGEKMGEFRAAAGQIHLLFADVDEYYTDSLVRLDREQYINYCLRKAGYQGIYFIEKQLTGKGGYRVIMGSPVSADLYCYQNPSDGWFLAKKPVLRETEGKRVFCRHNSPEEVTGRILSMLQNQGGLSMTFVMEPEIFVELYQDRMAGEQLRNLLETVKNSIFLLVSSMKADESFPVFTENPLVFGGNFFREFKKLFAAEGHFRFYEELKNELGDGFHLWNQMKREELYRMLQYLWLTEKGWQKLSVRTLEQGTEFLYAWCHQPEVEVPKGLCLSEKSQRNLGELRKCLRGQAEAFVESLSEWESKRTGRVEGKPWYPVFSETADVRRLRQGIRDIVGPERQRLAWKLDRVTEIMVCPWSDFQKLERPGLQEMLKKMEELKEENCRSSEMAERVLDYLYYSFRSEGQHDTDEVYQMKCDCHREIVRCTAMVARMEKIHEKRQETLRKNEQEFARRRQELKEQCERDPLYAEVLCQMKAGTLELGVATEYRMDISQKKGVLVSLQRSIQTEKQYMISGQEEIAVQKNSIEKLDLVLKELMAEKNPTALASILNRAGMMLQEQGSMEREAQNALKKAASLFEKEASFLKEEKKTEETDWEVWYV